MRLKEEMDRYNSIYIPRYHAQIVQFEEQDIKYDDVDQFLEYISCMVSIHADPHSAIHCIPESFYVAYRLFVLGAIRSGCLNDVQAHRMGDCLIRGELPKSTDVYQYLAYILRLEEHHCGIDMTITLPLIAMFNTLSFKNDVDQSNRVLGAIQAFSVLDHRYARKTLVSYDPMRYVTRLQYTITSASKNCKWEGNPYLEYMLACIRDIAVAYLLCVVQRTSKSTVFRKQASKVLSTMLTHHRTVVNTNYIKQCK